jgi:AcrR family transcriptional regulator
MEVAATELIERGYRATSLERLAEQAGYSKGAVYSNFAGKEELVLAVLDQHFVNRLNILQEALLAAPETLEDRMAAFTAWWEGMVGEQEWGVLILEFASATRDRPGIQAQLADREQRILGFVTMLIEAEAERFGVRLPLTAHELASVLVALGSGLSFSRMLEPTIPIGVLSDLARILFVDLPRAGAPAGQDPVSPDSVIPDAISPDAISPDAISPDAAQG